MVAMGLSSSSRSSDMNALPLLSPHDAIARWGEYQDLLEHVIAEDRLHSMTLDYAQQAVVAGKLRSQFALTGKVKKGAGGTGFTGGVGGPGGLGSL